MMPNEELAELSEAVADIACQVACLDDGDARKLARDLDRVAMRLMALAERGAK